MENKGFILSVDDYYKDFLIGVNNQNLIEKYKNYSYLIKDWREEIIYLKSQSDPFIKKIKEEIKILSDGINEFEMLEETLKKRNLI